MKKIILCCVWLSLLFQASAQLKFIRTGRPQSFAYNNAERVTGKRWGITFSYMPFDGVSFDKLDSITAINEATEKKLAAKKGADWNAVFMAEVSRELKLQDSLRAKILEQITDMPPFPLLVHFAQAGCPNKYKAFVFSQMELEDKRTYNINYEYKINMKSGKIRLRSEKIRPVPFEYPENGITRDGQDDRN